MIGPEYAKRKGRLFRRPLRLAYTREAGSYRNPRAREQKIRTPAHVPPDTGDKGVVFVT